MSLKREFPRNKLPTQIKGVLENPHGWKTPEIHKNIEWNKMKSEFPYMLEQSKDHKSNLPLKWILILPP